MSPKIINLKLCLNIGRRANVQIERSPVFQNSRCKLFEPPSTLWSLAHKESQHYLGQLDRGSGKLEQVTFKPHHP
jgi:hypothetical protein